MFRFTRELADRLDRDYRYAFFFAKNVTYMQDVRGSGEKNVPSMAKT